LLVSTRSTSPFALATRSGWRLPALALALLLAALAFVGLRGNSAIAASAAAASRSNWAAAAADARTAIRWAPWSSSAWKQLGDVEIQQGKLGRARISLRKAVGKDPADWAIWLDLATVTTGRKRSEAIAEAAKLNPLSPEVAFLKPHGRRP
jgi:cytochrome c-type biogenesis protein CcmH/NrfG